VAPLVVADSMATLEATDVGGRIVLLQGDIARDQLLPRGFDFVDEPDHRRIHSLLEDGGAAGIIGATGRSGGMGGGLYPYPLIEDGDFDTPNAYVTDETGRLLAAFGGEEARLRIVSHRFPVRARQLTAQRGPIDATRVVVMAHLDSKEGSLGAVQCDRHRPPACRRRGPVRGCRPASTGDPAPQR
jgi:aminopeptidase YwaD